MTSTPTKPVDNVVIATKGLQDRNINIIAGTTVENKDKLILTIYIIQTLFFNVVSLDTDALGPSMFQGLYTILKMRFLKACRILISSCYQFFI